MNVVRRLALQFGTAIAVMIAAAVMDLGPRASAAYVSMADVSVGCGAIASSDCTPSTPPNLNSDRERDGLPALAGYLQGNGGMSSSGSSSSSNTPPVVGNLSRTELPTDGLVVYFREPAASIHLTAFIDSLLDPPRQA